MINKNNGQESPYLNLTYFTLCTVFSTLLISPTMTQAAYSSSTYNMYTTDTDGDGVVDAQDNDDDNDGIPDTRDGLSCTSPTQEIKLTGDGTFENLYATASSYASGDQESNGIATSSLGNYFDVLNHKGVVYNPDAWIGPVPLTISRDPATTRTADGTPASPDGRVFVGMGVVDIYDKLGTGVGIRESFPIENLVVGANYQVKFYQVNAGRAHTPVGSKASIAVHFNDQLKTSPEMSFQGRGNQTWQAVTMNFTATSPTLSTFGFSPYGGSDNNTVTLTDSTGGTDQVPVDYVGIDAIKLIGPQCTTTDVNRNGVPDHLDVPAATLSNVTDINSGSNTAQEGAASGSAVGVTANAKNSLGGSVTYSLTNNAGGLFTINSQTGVITVTRSPSSGNYTVTVAAKSSGLTKSASFTIDIVKKAVTSSTRSAVEATATLSEIVDIDPKANKVSEEASDGTIVGITASATNSGNFPVTYSLTNSANGLFAINSQTGVVVVTRSPVKGNYIVTISAKSNGLTKSTDFAIDIMDKEAATMSEIVDIDPRANKVSVDSPDGTIVGIRVSATNSKDSPVTYSILNSDKFAIITKGVDRGWVYLNGSLKGTTERKYDILVEAKALDGLTKTGVFTIEVEGIPDVLSEIADIDPKANKVSENAPDGTIVGITASAKNSGNFPVTYSLTNSAGGLFAIDSQTGVVIVTRSLVKGNDRYIVTIEAKSNGLTKSADFVIDIDRAPATLSELTDTDARDNKINIDDKLNTPVGVSAQTTHSRGLSITYSILNNDKFGILNKTTSNIFDYGGMIYLNSSLEGTTERKYDLLVEAKTTDGLTKTGVFTIEVEGIPDEISEIVDIDPKANKVSENAPDGTIVGITASAKSSGNFPVTYSLTNSAGGLFAIDSQTGVVIVTRSLVKGNDRYIVTIEAKSNGLTKSADFFIDIDRAPATLSELTDTDARDNKINIDDKLNTPVGVSAQTTHSRGRPITYSILNNDKFGILSKTTSSTSNYGGMIYLKSSLEGTTERKYDLLVEAKTTDGLTKTGVFTIEVEGIPDEISEIVDIDPKADEVSEDAPVGTPVGITVSATHSGNLPVNYSFFGDGNGFNIDGKTGVITVASKLNYSTAQKHSLLVQASSSDGLTQMMSFSVNIKDVDDKMSAIVDKDTQANQVDESALIGSTVGITVSATHNGLLPVSYSLLDDAGGLFAIDSKEGVVTVAGNLDYEKTQQHEIRVEAKTTDGLTQTQSFTIEVQNSKADTDNPVGDIMDIDESADEVLENAPIGSTVGITASATDPDGDEIEYRLINNANGLFTIGTKTGIVTAIATLDYESAKEYTITIQATSADGSTTQKTVTLSVIDDIQDNGVRLRVRALLQGAFNGKSGLMKTSLLDKGLIQYAQPYSKAPYLYDGEEQLDTNLLERLVDEYTIVDWVLIELRDKNDPLTVVARQAALLTANGDVVNMEGDTQLTFDTMLADNYYVALRHRNHLDVITEDSIAMSSKLKIVDFADTRTPVFGSNARLEKDNIAVLWAGDTNQDNRIILEGVDNDVNGIVTLALTSPDNPNYNVNFITYGYTSMDTNMDGRSIFSGANNDLNIIIGNVLVSPGNKTYSKNYIIQGSLWMLEAR